MTATCEDDVICDFAETYHIYNYRGLPLRLAATLACGLRDSSRIRMRMAGCRYTLDQILLASASDAARILAWMQTKSAKLGINRPQSIVALMTAKPQEQPVSFNSAEEFERRRKEIMDGYGIR